MRGLWLFGALLVMGCREQTHGGPPAKDEPPNAIEAARSTARWELQSSGEGTSLVLYSSSRDTVIWLACAAGKNQLLVNVPGFAPIGSEERLSFGGGRDAVSLVADARGDRQRGGVSGTGAVPANLGELLSGPVAASYGAQTSGPHPTIQAQEARRFAAACNKPSPDRRPPPQPAHPCNSQDGKPLPPMHLKALGTEPFWAARIEGRCVTYSHPDNQTGTRLWTRFSGTADRGSWTGSLDGRPFMLVTRPNPGCSDGMSDRRYPIAVALTVGGEQRQGCAERP